MQNINVNIVPDNFPQTIRYSQGDIGRQFKINVADFDIPVGATVKIQATKPSGFGFSVAGVVSDNSVTFTTTEEMTDEAGRFQAELQITAGGDVIGTANFLMIGERNPHPEGTTDGSQGTIIPELTLLVERVEKAASDVLDMEVVATTLPAGSQATYSYDEDLNKATFGIPEGQAGAGAAGVVASAYSAAKTYKVGDYVLYNSNLYRCTTAITTAEAWTAAHWTQVVLADDVTDLKSDFDNIREIIASKNLVDNSELVQGFILDTGVVSTSGAWGNYHTTGYIELEPNTDYVFSTVNILTNAVAPSARIGKLLFDTNKSPIDGTHVNQATGGTLTFNSGNAKYARCSFPMIVGERYPQFEKGTAFSSFELYHNSYYSSKLDYEFDDKILTQDEVMDLKVSKKKHTSKNLVNLGEVQRDKYLQQNTLYDNTGYDTSGYIPVKAGQKITFSPKIRSASLYLTDKTFIVGSDSSVTSSSPYTITPVIDGYVRVSFYSSDRGIQQAEYGDTATSYVPNDNSQYFEEDVRLSESMKEEVKSLIDGSSSPMSIILNDNSLVIESFKDGNSIRRTYELNGGGNLNFNFRATQINGKLIKDSDDDIAPQRFGLGNGSNWTIGANHGWVTQKATKGSLTQADTGSIWTDGTRQYILAKVDSTYAYFLRPCTKADGKYSFGAAPSADLTHVSGATHTDTVPISGMTESQLYPSVNNHSLDIYANGKKITQNGAYITSRLIVKEHYEIMDFIGMSNYLKAHIGSDLATVRNNIDSVLALDYTYIITEDSEVIYSCVRAIDEINLANSGFIQATAIYGNNGTVYRYVNGVKNGTDFASSSLVDMTNYNADKTIKKSDLIDPSKPVNRCVDICKDGNGNILYGFVIGFIPDKSFGADSKRASILTSDSSVIWDMRSTKKSYPYCVYNKTLSTGESINVVTYRHYIMPNTPITNETVININDEEYMFIDSHSNTYGTIDSNAMGKSVKELDNSSVIVSDVVGSNGVTYNVLSNYGTATLKTN